MSPFVVRSSPPTFEDVTGLVAASTISIAAGLRTQDGTPQIVGTGFAVEHSELFATCFHVMKKTEEISEMQSSDLQKAGLKDGKLRIALPMPQPESYRWLEIQAKSWFRVMVEELDVCILKIVGVAIPTLSLYSQQDISFGHEVGVLGFPLGNQLQGKQMRPFVLKTVVSGMLENTPANGLTADRLALGIAVAGGFSGSPVFSAQDGLVIGMVASKPLEVLDPSQGQVWPAGVSLAVTAGQLRQVMDNGLPRMFSGIKEALRKGLP